MVREAKSRRRWPVLPIGAGVLYTWGLGASGWAISYYSAAVPAGSQSWQAFFFGASDASNAITVDKTPASLWPMVLSVRLFGLSSWAVLVPQALMGVGAVAMVYASVRRLFNAWAGLLAGVVMALTPVAVLMFRFNNPDALLVPAYVEPGKGIVGPLVRPAAASRVVWQAPPSGRAMFEGPRPPWTRGGEPVPFVPSTGPTPADGPVFQDFVSGRPVAFHPVAVRRLRTAHRRAARRAVPPSPPRTGGSSAGRAGNGAPQCHGTAAAGRQHRGRREGQRGGAAVCRALPARITGQ